MNSKENFTERLQMLTYLKELGSMSPSLARLHLESLNLWRDQQKLYPSSVEIFGPVQVVIPFEDEEDAVKIANSTKYGLVASIWTLDGARQMRVAKAIKSGQVFINNYGAGGGVELPFGGKGYSGHGREKGFEALYGFSTLKTVAALHE